MFKQGSYDVHIKTGEVVIPLDKTIKPHEEETCVINIYETLYDSFNVENIYIVKKEYEISIYRQGVLHVDTLSTRHLDKVIK